MDLEKDMLRARVQDMSEEELRLALMSIVDGASVYWAVETSYHRIKKVGGLKFPAPSWPPCGR